MPMTPSMWICGSPILSPSETGHERFASFVPSHLKEDGEPVFAEPWQAQAFAMAIALSRQGLFTWEEWAARLGAEIKAGNDDDDRMGARYYEFWLAALEGLVAEKGAASPESLTNLRSEWAEAYRHTPHGQPVKLASHD